MRRCRRLDHPRHGVGRLQRRDDAFGVAQQSEGVEDLLVRRQGVLGPADGGQVGVLGAEARIVQSGRDRLGLQDLPGLVLQEVGVHAVQDARDAVR